MFSSEYLEIHEKPCLQIFPPCVGRLFSAFNGKRFIPIEELRQCYPEDEAVAEKLLAEYE